MKREKVLGLLFIALWALGCAEQTGSLDSDAEEKEGEDTESGTLFDTETAEETPIECEGYNEADYPEVPVEFEVIGSQAIMYGYVDGTTPGRLDTLLQDNPQLETLVMPFVPGSVDDESNLQAARIVREAGLDTCIPSTGLIASGGVDFFVAGVRRSANEGAQVGVHSWAGFGGVEGSDFPKDSLEHQLYLLYYEEMGIPAEFYWFTLEPAPADSVHWMTVDEIAQYELLTD